MLVQDCEEMTLKVFHFSTKAEQIETQCGAAVWQEPERGGGETDNRYTHFNKQQSCQRWKSGWALLLASVFGVWQTQPNGLLIVLQYQWQLCAPGNPGAAPIVSIQEDASAKKILSLARMLTAVQWLVWRKRLYRCDDPRELTLKLDIIRMKMKVFKGPLFCKTHP